MGRSIRNFGFFYSFSGGNANGALDVRFFMIPKVKQKTCKCCKTLFIPNRPLAKACSPLCALTIVRAEAAKKIKLLDSVNRKDTRAKLIAMKTRAQWAREAQTAFNAWVRARDYGKACISCGRHHQGQNHAGHYLSVGARPELRYEPLNVHLQCAPCNTHLSGNAILYRKSLLKKLGLDIVEWLEGPHPARHYSIEDLKQIKITYSAKSKAILK